MFLLTLLLSCNSGIVSDTGLSKGRNEMRRQKFDPKLDWSSFDPAIDEDRSPDSATYPEIKPESYDRDFDPSYDAFEGFFDDDFSPEFRTKVKTD